MNATQQLQDLGQSLHEHSVFARGVIWGIDLVDQWGVEMGKALAPRIGEELQRATAPASRHDSSTTELMRRYMVARNGSVT